MSRLERFLAGTVYAYFGLALAHWWHLSRVMRAPPGCGNVIIDPLWFLINAAGPYAALCVAALLVGRLRLRRRPLLPFLVPPLFFGTSVALGLEVIWLCEFGISFSGAVWWLPGL
jgi:hypothetical protein